MSHQTDWDRGFEAGKAQGACDAFGLTDETFDALANLLEREDGDK